MHHELTENALNFAVKAFKKINDSEINLLKMDLKNIQISINQLADEETIDEDGKQIIYTFHRKCVYGEYILTTSLKYVAAFDPKFLEKLSKKIIDKE